MTRTIDFDAFRAEQTHEGLELLLGGKVYELPPALPAALALDIARLQATKGPDADFSENDVRRLGAALFGSEERMLEILRDGAVTIEEMPDLIKMVMEKYGGGPGPNRKARRAEASAGRSHSR